MRLYVAFRIISDNINKEWQDWTDKKLADEAQTGLRGQGTIIEATRRLREELKSLRHSTFELKKLLAAFSGDLIRQQQSTNVLTKWVIVLTVALLLAAVIQIVLMYLQLQKFF